MILGIGTDLIEIERIRRAVDHARTGERFRRRVFTDGEIEYCTRRRRGYAESFAARFAAKEAVMKALGRGFVGGGIGWRDIEVVRENGPPRVVLHGRARERARRRGIERWHLALTHSGTLAMAYVIAEGGDAMAIE